MLSMDDPCKTNTVVHRRHDQSSVPESVPSQKVAGILSLSSQVLSCFQKKSETTKQVIWILDTGATDHVVSDLNLFYSFFVSQIFFILILSCPLPYKFSCLTNQNF